MNKLFKYGHASVWFGRRKEKAILTFCKKHFDKVFETIVSFKEFIEAFKIDDLEKIKISFKNIFDLEREADNIKESIIDELSRGPLHPIDREDIIRMVMTVDDIAANIKSSARKITYVDSKSVPLDIKNGMLEIVNMVHEEAKFLGEALNMLIDNPNEAIELCEKVERIEEEIDDKRVELMNKVLDWANEIKIIKQWTMIKEAIENIEAAADYIENSADVIRSLVVLSSI
ncbi:MAG: DUF47 family protein [Nitrososphaerota archaeon]